MKRIKMECDAKSITLQQAFEAFARKCQLRNLAKDTIFYYQESFKYLTTVSKPFL